MRPTESRRPYNEHGSASVRVGPGASGGALPAVDGCFALLLRVLWPCGSSRGYCVAARAGARCGLLHHVLQLLRARTPPRGLVDAGHAGVGVQRCCDEPRPNSHMDWMWAALFFMLSRSSKPVASEFMSNSDADSYIEPGHDSFGIYPPGGGLREGARL